MKKLIIALAMIQLTAFGQSSKSFMIDGRYGTFNKPVKVYLEYSLGDATIIDSVELKNGFFTFTGKASNAPAEATLIFDTKGVGRTNSMEQRSLYLEPGIIKFVTKNATVMGSQVTGTP